MPKNIVICSDGTGNSAIKDRGTNVFKLYEAVDLSRGDQIAFYDDGVGAESFKPLQILGGAFGWGLSANVRQLYTALARVYDPGDRIFLFGFSRGAFTVRTLADFIVTCGILDRKKFRTDAALQAMVRRAYRDVYRRNYLAKIPGFFSKKLEEKEAAAFRQEWGVAHAEHAPGGIPFIEFVGVWDTVDAVGFPVDEIADFVNAVVHQFKFPDQVLSPHVRKGCHAVSVDDERHTFHPVLWDERGEDKKNPRIEQVWFAGVHANVGGGYPKQGMSLVSLDWMMAHADAAGLRFVASDWDFYREHRSVHDKLYNSRSGLAAYYHYKPRDIAALCAEHGVTPKVHVSALERIGQGTEGYAPGNVPGSIRIVETRGTGRDLAAAETAVRAALPGGSAPLDGVRGQVRLREWNQTFTILFSLIAFAGLAALGSGRGSLRRLASEFFSLLSSADVSGLLAFFKRSGGFFSMVFSADVPGLLALFGRAFVVNWKQAAVLIALPLVFYGLGRGIKGRMERTYSEFWFRLAPGLRKLLC